MRLTMLMMTACALAACTPPAAPPPLGTGPAANEAPAPIATPTAATEPGKLLQARRAFAAAEIEWQSAIAVGRALVRHGVLKGEVANSVREWNARARTVIVAGKRAGDVAAQASATAELVRLTDWLDAVTGRD